MSSPRCMRVSVPAVGMAWVLAAAVGAFAAEPGRTGAAPAALARQLLDMAGVKGGLVVHFGCAGGELTAAFRASDVYVVHGLAFDAAAAEKARRYVQSLGLYGNVSVEFFSGDRLPYVDNLVNLFVAEDLHGLSMDEVLRVVAPGGAACIRRDGRWVATAKPRPATIDDWTHALYDASNNAVSHDTVVAPPQHFQWIAEPRY